MDNKEAKLSCGVCHAYLFEEDDVVYCPVCGAPHHRECYKSIGHCAFEDAHGTDKQYRKPDFSNPEQEIKNEKAKPEYEVEIKCDICGSTYSAEMPACPDCGAPNFKAFGGPFAKFDSLGGIPEDTDLGEGVTAREARRFVFVNTKRYIPKFAAMRSGRKVGWNWFAFLFPCGWFLSRKMYAEGIITGILSVCFSMFLLPYMQIVDTFVQSYTTNSELISALLENPPTISAAVILLFYAGMISLTLLHVFSALFADRIYRNHVIETVKSIKDDSEDPDYDNQKKGGVNFLLMFLGIFGVRFITEIIFYYLL